MTTNRLARIGIVGWLLAIVGGVGGLLLRIARPAPILPTTVGVGPTALAVAVAAIVSLAVGLRNEIQLTASSTVAPSSLSIWLRAPGADR